MISSSGNLNSLIAVVIPALNEEAAIGKVVNAIPRNLTSNIIVVDNGSSDRTAEVATLAGASVLHEQRRGYGYACMLGIVHAMQSHPSIIAFLDGDLSDHPEELTDIVRPFLEDNYDLVIGSRMLGRREPGAMLPQAMIGNWIATTLIRLFWGYRFTDLGPFRAVRTESLQRLNMSQPTFGWTVEMQIKAAKLGLKCREVPVSYRKRVGKSKVTGTINGTIRASIGILLTIFKNLFVRA